MHNLCYQWLMQHNGNVASANMDADRISLGLSMQDAIDVLGDTHYQPHEIERFFSGEWTPPKDFISAVVKRFGGFSAMYYTKRVNCSLILEAIAELNGQQINIIDELRIETKKEV